MHQLSGPSSRPYRNSTKDSHNNVLQHIINAGGRNLPQAQKEKNYTRNTSRPVLSLTHPKIYLPNGRTSSLSAL